MNPAPSDTPAAPRRLLDIRHEGRRAELVIDTGHRLSTGRTWQTYAKVYCESTYAAALTAAHLRERLSGAVAEARRRAYLRGYRDARRNRPPLKSFPGEL